MGAIRAIMRTRFCRAGEVFGKLEHLGERGHVRDGSRTAMTRSV